MEPQQQAIQAQGGNPNPFQSLFQNVVGRIQQSQQAFGQQERVQDQQQPQANSQGAVSQALGILGDNSTAGQVGQGISNDPSFANRCEAFAEQQIYGHQGMYPTAYAAFQANAQQGNINTSMDNIPAGAQLFFAPDSSNGGAGHTGVMNNDSTFTAPLSNGNIDKFTLSDWLKYSGQQFIGWAPPPSGQTFHNT